MSQPKEFIQQLLTKAAIQINGNHPWDIQVHDDRLYERVLKHASLGLGEAYMDGWWDCASLDQFFFRLLRTDLENIVLHSKYFWLSILRYQWQHLLDRLINRQTIRKAGEVGKRHYDIGNDLFQRMLDKRMMYSCAYWKNSQTLDEAQNAKLELICQKLQLKPGMRVLDIGCGWGGFARYAAENYQVNVVGVTISKQQEQLARQICQDLPIDIRLQDYRAINEPFDRICSIGMFEHVGVKNYRTYFETAYRCLPEGGLFLLHTIGSNNSTHSADEWIANYIFPNGHLPSVAQIGAAIEKLFIMEDWHNFGADYDKTLMAWRQNFNRHWPDLKQKYDDRFYRMWTYYLLSCAGAFRARDIELWQVVLAKKGVIGGYQSVR